MGAFSSIARSLGDFGSDFGTARANADQVNQQRQAFAQQQAAQKIKDVMTGLQIRELQQRMQQQQQAAQLQTPEGQKAYLKSLLGRDPTEDEIQRYLKIAPPAASTRLPSAVTYVDPATKQQFTGTMSADGIVNVDTKKVVPGAIKWEKPEATRAPTVSTYVDPATKKQFTGTASTDGIVDVDTKKVVPGAIKYERPEKPDKETYNIDEQMHREHPEWTPEQVLAASKQTTRADAVKAYQSAVSAVTRYRNAKVGAQKIGDSSSIFKPGTWGAGSVANANLTGVKNDAEAMRQDAIAKLADAGMTVPDWLTKPIDEEANVQAPKLPTDLPGVTAVQ